MPDDIDQVADGGHLAVLTARKPHIAQLLLDRVAATPDREAYRYPVGDEWRSMTWRQVGTEVRRRAAGLVALGIEPEQRVAIASNTRVEWVLCDLAIVCAGGGDHHGLPDHDATDVAFILADSESGSCSPRTPPAGEAPRAPQRAPAAHQGRPDRRHAGRRTTTG